MGLFSSTQPSLRARILPRFPAQVLAGNGMSITKSGGTYTFATTTAPLPPLTFATLPASPAAGTLAYITDSTVVTWGQHVTNGSGSSKVLIWYNGTFWTVVGI